MNSPKQYLALLGTPRRIGKERRVIKDKFGISPRQSGDGSLRICQGERMPKSSADQPHDGNPTSAEIFRIFRETTEASISGLKLLLEECADVRADLITIHGRTETENGGDGVFSARQQNRIVELRQARRICRPC